MYSHFTGKFVSARLAAICQLAVLSCALLSTTALGADFNYLPDPTQPGNLPAAAPTQEEQQKLVLNSLLFSEQRRVAVINGQVMLEGDSAGGVTVQAIRRGEVIVTLADNQVRHLKLGSVGTFLKKPSPPREVVDTH